MDFSRELWQLERSEAKIWNEKKAIGLVSKKDFIDFIATTNQQPERGPVLRKLAGEISLHVSSIHLRVNGWKIAYTEAN